MLPFPMTTILELCRGAQKMALPGADRKLWVLDKIDTLLGEQQMGIATRQLVGDLIDLIIDFAKKRMDLSGFEKSCFSCIGPG